MDSKKTSWNKGLKFEKKVLERSLNIIEKGEHLLLHEATARKHAKRYLIHYNGNTCSICGNTEWMGQKIPLVCDHIDGSSENNEISNFRLVCCNCDAQLPTYKSKNKRGRLYDRRYYQEHKKQKVKDFSGAMTDLEN